jgi:hypothetical protein
LKSRNFKLSRSSCPKECEAGIDLEEQLEIGKRILKQIEGLPRGNRIPDIRYKINEYITRSNQVKQFTAS